MANMSLWIRVVFFGLLVSQANGIFVTIFQTLFDVGQFAYNIVSAAQQNARIEKKLFELDRNIAGYITDAKKEIITSIGENSKMQELDNIVKYVDSSMTDMKKIFDAENQTYANETKEDFVRRFREHEIVKLVRDLKTLLTYNNMIQGFALLPHIKDKYRCNLTVLKNFALFYLNLVSDGIALQAMYGKITQRHFSLKKLEENEWAAALKEIEKQFNKVEKECIGQFKWLAREDFNAAWGAGSLGQRNMKRYIYNWIDVMFYAPYHGFEFHCVSGSNFFMKKRDKDMNKVAVYGPRRSKPGTNNEQTRSKPGANQPGAKREQTSSKPGVFTIFTYLLEGLFRFNKSTQEWDAKQVSQLLYGLALPDEKAKNAACVVNDNARRLLKRSGYYPSDVVVYFVGNDHYERSTFQDKDSPVATYTLPNVELSYCHRTEFECFFKRGYAKGEYKIYVYP